MFALTSNTSIRPRGYVWLYGPEGETSNKGAVFLTATALKVRLQCILKKLIQTIMLFETVKVSAV